MNKENCVKLSEKYHELFDGTFYFDCGDGWFNIISELLKFLQFHCIENNHIYSNIKIRQIKQKFGVLRVYVDFLDADKDKKFLQGAIAYVEYQSVKVCEKCGSIEKVEFTKSGYTQPLCLNCRKEIKEK
jgi:hypothetical protein